MKLRETYIVRYTVRKNGQNLGRGLATVSTTQRIRTSKGMFHLKDLIEKVKESREEIDKDSEVFIENFTKISKDIKRRR